MKKRHFLKEIILQLNKYTYYIKNTKLIIYIKFNMI